MTHSPRSKSLLLAALLGFVFPGLGLFYAAPWKVALLGSIVALASIKLFGWIPLVGAVIVGTVGLASAVLCVLFANAHNEGRYAR